MKGANRPISPRRRSNLIFALNVSLGQILQEGLPARIERHVRWARPARPALPPWVSARCQSSRNTAANTMTAPRLPSGNQWPEFLSRVGKAG